MRRRRATSRKPAKAQAAIKAKRSSAAVTASQSNLSVTDLQERLTCQTLELEQARDERAVLADVLRVISSSSGDLKPVFQTMLENAVRICDAKFGNIYRWDGDALRLAATHNTPRAFAELRKNEPFRPGPNTPTGRMVTTKSVTQVADLAQEPGYVERDPLFVSGVEVGGIRTLLSVPMLKGNELIGAFTIYRQEVRPFTEQQIALVMSFAAQAVIAIENTTLLNELRQRTADLTESLEKQTATSEVLRVISSSPGELGPVFETILANAVRICEAKFGNLLLTEGDAFRAVALHGAPQAYAEERRRAPVVRPHPETTFGRAVSTKQPVQIGNVQDEPNYPNAPPGFTGAKLAELAGARTVLFVPMLKGAEVVGAILIYRQQVRLFTDKQIELVQNFAAQAVIAIENARLLNELARGGQEGLRLVRELRPAAVTLDIMMPDLDGWTVLAAIKGDPALASTPVVLMSIVDQKNRGYALGAADYLVKPVDRAKLVETLTHICASSSGKALLVDDDEMVRRSVRQALEPVGWKVTEAENGQVAVEALATAQPDVIILDLMMPKMDGFEFLDELRSRPDWQDIPVVIITAKDLTEKDRARLNGGVERIIQKSDRDEMLRQLTRAISKCVKRQAVRGA